MASSYLSKTFSSGTTKKWTFSCWIKRSNISDAQTLFYASPTANSNFESIGFTTSGDLDWEHYEYTTSSYKGRLKTNRLFRDVGAWMHIVCVFDSANATAGDRMRLYVNGTEETSFQTDTNPSLNQDAIINGANPHTVASYGASQYFDGSMAHIHFTDGYAYAATDFGETDSTTGIWKPKASPSVTYGTNGFFLKFENSGSMGTDSSGNTNTFTVNGTPTQTVDSPSNNFATGNPLIPNGDSYSNGNNTHTTSSANYRSLYSSLGVTKGKWYVECKMTNVGSGNGFGIANQESGVGLLKTSANKYFGQDTNDVGYYQDGSLFNNSSAVASYATISSNDIVQIALDVDNGYIYFGKNGTWQNSGDPTSGATGTGGYAISNIGSNGTYFFGTSMTTPATSQLNFGNGYFGTSAVASAGTNAGGIGTFEYDVPSGYYALCTKNINSYG